jgi:hypothetical protein
MGITFTCLFGIALAYHHLRAKAERRWMHRKVRERLLEVLWLRRVKGFETYPRIGNWPVLNQYARPLGRTNVEVATLRVLHVPAPIHFHDADQLTFVLSGSRRFTVRNELGCSRSQWETRTSPQACFIGRWQKTLSFPASPSTHLYGE